MNESPQQYFLTQASKQLDLVGPTSYDKSMSAISRTLNYLTKDPTNLWDYLDLVRHLAFYTGGLWRNSPTLFTTPDADLTALPDNIGDLKGTEYDMVVLETLINRCPRASRWGDGNHGAGWYVTNVEFPDAPDNCDETIIAGLTNYFAALLHAPEPDPALLSLLLSAAWELYLRALESSDL